MERQRQHEQSMNGDTINCGYVKFNQHEIAV